MSIQSYPEAIGGLDPLFQDPLAKASYSSNPTFIEGSTAAHPINKQQKSLLAQPEIAEALEAVYLSALSEAGEAETAGGTMDFELAKNGLKRMRKTIDPSSPLKKRIVDTKSYLSLREEVEKNKAWNEQQVAEQARTRQCEREAAEQAKEVARVQQAEEEAKQAQYRHQLSGKIEKIREEQPELKGSAILALGNKLEICDEGQLTVREKDGFQMGIQKRIGEYLDDPSELANDLTLLELLIEDEKEQLRYKDSPVYKYGFMISETIKEKVGESYYSPASFSTEAVKKWMEVVAEHPGIKVLASGPLLSVDNDPVGRFQSVALATNTTQQHLVIASSAVQLGGNVFCNTLRETIDKDADRFIDNAYRVAEAGLDPDSDAKRRFAVAILSEFFEVHPFALEILYGATVSQNEKIQRKAIDLRQTLIAIDPLYSAQALNNSRMKDPRRDLSRSQLRILGDIWGKYLKLNGKVLNRGETVELDELQAERIERFIEFATSTQEGSSSTLYGRFAKSKHVAGRELLTTRKKSAR